MIWIETCYMFFFLEDFFLDIVSISSSIWSRCNLLSKRVCMWLVQLGLESSIERDGRDGTSKRELTLLHFGNGRLRSLETFGQTKTQH
jgi:hypothetical protein